MKLAASITEILILVFVTINCYVNVAKYLSDRRKDKNTSEQDK